MLSAEKLTYMSELYVNLDDISGKTHRIKTWETNIGMSKII